MSTASGWVAAAVAVFGTVSGTWSAPVQAGKTLARPASAAVATGTAKATASGLDAIVSYPIRRGDTLFNLSRAYFSGAASLAVVRRMNRIADANTILSGGTLRIPRRLLRDVQTFARVESFSGEVILRPAGAAFPARIGATVGEGALIETGRGGFISLRLADDSVISLPSQSQVRIVRLRKILLTGALEREFTAETGRVRARVTPMDDPASNFRVRTPLTVSAVRGTEFRIGFNPAAAVATTEVEDGKVEVGTAAATARTPGMMVLPGFGAATTPTGTSGAVALLPAPRLSDPDAVQTEADLHFPIEPVPGANRYRIQLARDAGLLDMVSEATNAGPVFTLPSLPAGTYFARITALDGNGIEGLPRTYVFDRVRNGVAGTMGTSGTGRERRYLFKWLGVADGAPQFRFQLARKADPVNVLVDEPLGTATEISVTNLPPAEYAWRVLSIVPRGTKVVRAWSGEQTFEVTTRK